MKHFITSIAFGFLLMNLYAQQPAKVLYINLNSHNETTDGAYDGATSSYYDTYYAKIKELADSVISKKACWNFQSDVRFLMGVLKWDPRKLNNSVSGSNLNLLKWMDDSYYIECDPHSHESIMMGKQMNYADCAYLHDSLGMPNRKNVGGYKWDGLQNGSDWQWFENGMPCKTFTWAPAWKPNVLWGGSYSAGVHNDLNAYGMWKPGGNTTATFFNHTPGRRVRNMGNGCEMHFTDSTVDSRITSNLRMYAEKVYNGGFPSGVFYTQSIQIDVRDFAKPGFVARVSAILDTVNQLVKEGKAVWATISQKDSIWLHQLDSAAFISNCDQVTSYNGISEVTLSESFQLYPNPAGDVLHLNINQKMSGFVYIYNIQGQLIQQIAISGNNADLNVSTWPEGVYQLMTSSDTNLSALGRFVVQH